MSPLRTLSALPRRSAALAVALALTACSDPTPVEPASTFPGLYVLEWWDGEGLPVERHGIAIDSGSLRLDSGGTLLYTLIGRIGGTPTLTELTGTYTTTGRTITVQLVYPGGFTEDVRGTLHEDVLTLVFVVSREQYIVFRRQR